MTEMSRVERMRVGMSDLGLESCGCFSGFLCMRGGVGICLVHACGCGTDLAERPNFLMVNS